MRREGGATPKGQAAIMRRLVFVDEKGFPVTPFKRLHCYGHHGDKPRVEVHPLARQSRPVTVKVIAAVHAGTPVHIWRTSGATSFASGFKVSWGFGQKADVGCCFVRRCMGGPGRQVGKHSAGSSGGKER